jgi:UDP-N-acetylmuramate: L-alanyl-gamma-D-glutamyl-meso-diaminopimelate ligase
MFSSEIKSVHFTGICGTAMASAAAAMKDKGFAVTGSDQDVYPPMSTFLAERKVEVMNGYAGRNRAALREWRERAARMPPTPHPY